MGKLTERNAAIASRCGDLSALAAPVRDRLIEGNKAAVLAGLTPQGQRVAPLKPSTLRHRKGDGPPRAPRGAASRVVAGYVVAVDAGPGRLAFSGSWPTFPQVQAIDLTRPTLGFRREDLDWTAGRLREHVTKG